MVAINPWLFGFVILLGLFIAVAVKATEGFSFYEEIKRSGATLEGCRCKPESACCCNSARP